MKFEIEKMKDGWSFVCSDGRWAEIVITDSIMAHVMYYDGESTEGYSLHNEDAMADVLDKMGFYDA